MKLDFSLINALYIPPNHNLWTGRKSYIQNAKEYWYQAVELIDLSCEKLEIEPYTIALLGYCCDEGVRRNQGRVGAANGPAAIRQRLAKMSWHNSPIKVVDIGDVLCRGEDMESCQLMLSNIISELIKHNIRPIVLGGGHDVAFGHFRGLSDALSNDSIGIVNFDAHFDLRPVEEQPNSGTPFFQILHTFNKNKIGYFVLGIQNQSNTKNSFDIASQLSSIYFSTYVWTNTTSYIDDIKKELIIFLNKHEHVYITIDLDGFSSACAPGVSAPSPLGFDPSFAFELLDFIFASEKVISCDVAEMNPVYDIDNQTSKLAAGLVDFMVRK